MIKNTLSRLLRLTLLCLTAAPALAADLPQVRFETNRGTFDVELYPERAPVTVGNFLKLVDAQFYDGLIFHRVIPRFMIHGGCPDGTGMGGPGYNIDAEFNDAMFTKGVLGMARSQDPNSAGSQFFICTADAFHLNEQYTAFGKVTSGEEVMAAIEAVPRNGQDKPDTDIVIETFTVS